MERRMCILRKDGPYTDPCGIPLVNVDHLERVSCNFTLCFLFNRKHSSQLKSLPLMPTASSLSKRILCCTLSKAFSKSI